MWLLQGANKREASTLQPEGFFMGETQIATDKLRAYLATQYRFCSEGLSIELIIGNHSDALAALFADQRVTCGAFITAFNPRGALQSDAANILAHACLADVLADDDVEILEGAGSEAGSDWPAERSWFAPGLSLDAARAIGIRFDQDAILWVDEDAVPQLVLLR